MSIDRVSIPHQRGGREVVSFGAYRFLESFRGSASQATEPVEDDTREKLCRAMRDFPELGGETITIARLDPKDIDNGTAGRADMLNRIVYLPTDRLSWLMTVYHELGHVAIQIRDENGEDVPTTSEEYCSIFSVARMPPDLIKRRDIAYIGRPSIPRDEWPETCQRALDYREEHRDYIRQCRDWLEI